VGARGNLLARCFAFPSGGLARLRANPVFRNCCCLINLYGVRRRFR
jgi:hypothetical protein